MSNENPTVFIIDDDPAVRDSLTLMIAQENFAVMAFDSAEAFLADYQPECLGCAIVDMRMGGMDGLHLQEEFSKQNFLLPIIFLTGHGNIPMSVRAMKSGAVDFLTKPVSRDKLLSAIRAAILESEKTLTTSMYQQDARSRLDDLTDRERDVMMLAIQGRPNKEIARLLNISHRTVEIHKSKIMHKTDTTNLIELSRLVHDGGLSN